MNIADWNVFDWVLVAIVLASMVRAFVTGLVRAITGFLGFVAGFEAASWAYIDLANRFRDQGWIAVESVARMVAFLLIVAAVVVAFEVLGLLLRKSLRAIGMSTFDRVLGAAFGFARGCLIGIALLIAAATFAPHSEFVASSVLKPYLFTMVHDVSFLIPDYVQERIL